MKRSPMTLRGAEGVARGAQAPQVRGAARVIKAIAEARGHGDLSENAEYHAAREQQGFIEGRINEIEAQAGRRRGHRSGQLPHTGKVVFGATVELEDQDDGSPRQSIRSSGEDEADIRAGRISITSPIARALIGKSQGDVVDVAAPGGVRSYEIVAVRVG